MESLQADGGSMDRVGDHKATAGMAGPPAPSAGQLFTTDARNRRLSAVPQGSATPDVLTSDLHSVMESTW